ncbi:iron-siderophore ABC transporter permease [Alicycliphilus denitrificans]|uniref:FecCD family ABC transporter permease n=1 Tax=Alicycliphilus denitrificans TaxID=179636 RepID=UPI0009620D92|nr:iron ABC transporter permease [Alicycliphilus denitrificans]MBN9573045.1 iron ABC transporter permease [Alicycliphilus denitrificans]OJW93173.1 MAG: iron ABC transporter permease [Alicycliphilus sp. 69-12]BCN36985.1 iron-siderophore ABC transporter permease [Alicycliphilus denitrificans]HRO80488.1 iron ABC transporter permease [Alicycliphilus denitrificans]
MTTLAARYRRFAALRLWLLAAMAVVLCATLALDLATGPSGLPFADVVAGLLRPAGLPVEQRVILWEVRLPYAVMALLVGASLGLAGAEMQTALNNPLASPFTLGLSAAAAVGASIAVVGGFTLMAFGENLAVPLSAFVCAAAATLLIQLLAWRYGATVDTVVLFGIALLFSFEALLWLMQFIADSNALQQIVFWTMGSLARATWNKIGLVAAVLLLCALWSAKNAWPLTALRAGEDQARSFGIAVERLRLVTLLRVSLLAATALSFVGTIGFVGLVGPHIARLLLGEDHRYYLPGAALAGALMLSGASILSKTLVPGVVLPIGIITALVGVPMFMALVLSRRRGA